MPNTRTRFLLWPKIQDEGSDAVTEPDIINFVGNGVAVTESPSRTAVVTINGGAQVKEDGTSKLNPALSLDFLNGPAITVDGTEANIDFRKKVTYEAKMLSNLVRGGSFSDAVPYYVWGARDMPATGGAAASLSANQVIFQQHLFRKDTTVDRILIQRTSTGTVGATGNVKMAIHTATSLTNVMPGSRFAASSVLTASLTENNGGGNTYRYLWDLSSTPLAFQAGTLYHFGILCDNAITNFHGPNINDLENHLGFMADTANNGIVGYSGLATAVTAGLYTAGFADPWDNATYPLLANAYNNFSIFYRVTALS